MANRAAIPTANPIHPSANPHSVASVTIKAGVVAKANDPVASRISIRGMPGWFDDLLPSGQALITLDSGEHWTVNPSELEKGPQ